MGVRPSPAITRGAALLRELARSDEPLSLAALSRGTAINKPSAHSLLLGLAQEGLVTRAGSPPTYRLGPALAALGRAAHSLALDELVDVELVRLHAELGTDAMAGQIQGNEIAVIAARTRAHPFGYSISTGTRLALRAPVGTLYLAWATDHSIDAWIARADPGLARAQVERLHLALRSIRRRGWSATVADADRSMFHEVDDDSDLGAAMQTVIGVSAPVWDHASQLACSIAVCGFSQPITGHAIVELAAAVTTSARRITELIVGVPPTLEGAVS